MDERREDEVARKVLDDVLHERGYQRNRWGTGHDVLHSHFEWVTILTTWLGKAASSAIGGDRVGLRKRLVQVAAICLASIEAIDQEPRP